MNVDLDVSEIKAIVSALEARAATFKLKLVETGVSSQGWRAMRAYVYADEALAQKLTVILKVEGE